MANFGAALQRVLREEGHYVNDPIDPGGATNMGISLRFLKLLGIDKYDLDGDGNIHEPVGDVNNDRILNAQDIKLLPLSFVSKIYKLYFWNPMCLDDLTSQPLAEQIFDIVVNMGQKRATQLLIKAIQKAGITISSTLPKDIMQILNNIIDVNTLISINNNLVQLRIQFYQSLNKPKFLKGWVNRARRFLI